MACDLGLLLYAGIHSDGCYVPLDDVAWIPSLLGLPLNQRGQVLLDDASTIAVLFDVFVTLINRLHRVTQKCQVSLVGAHRSCHDVPDILES